MAEVAVAGLGMIGGGVAGALLSAGHAVAVVDPRAEATAPAAARGATVAASPGEAVAGRDVLIVAVVDDAQVEDVVAGALPSMRPGAVVLVLSTVSVRTLESVAESAAARGVDVVDCGVTGGPRAAAQGALVSMLGGDEDAVARVLPVVEAFSSRAVRLGARGAGMRAKLVRNLMQYGMWAVAHEGRRLAEAAGLDVAALREVAEAGDAWTGGPLALFGASGDRDPEMLRAGAALARKDLAAAVELAETVGAEVPLTRAFTPGMDAVMGVPEGPGETGAAENGHGSGDADAPGGADRTGADRAGGGAPEGPDPDVAGPAPVTPDGAREAGLRMMGEVYAMPSYADAPRTPYLDMTIEHLFGRVWTRPGLEIAERRLLTIGVLAALGRDDLMELQFSSALERGELTVDQLREVVVHLAHYVGWPQTTVIGPMVERLARQRPEDAAPAPAAPSVPAHPEG